MQQHHKTQTKESRTDVGNEHGTVVETGLGEVAVATLRAVLELHEGLVEAEGAGWEEVAFTTFWAL